MSDRRGGSVDKVRTPLLLSRGDGEGQRRGRERLCPPPTIPLREPVEYFLVLLLGNGSWLPKLRRPRRGLDGMLVAPPVDGVRDEEDEGGRERRKPLLPSTEMEDPPPFHVDSKVEEPELCNRRPSLRPKLSWLRLREEREAKDEEGSDLRPGERGGADFKDMGGRSEP